MRKLLLILLVFNFSYWGFATDFLKQANADYLGMIKKVEIIQEVFSPNKKFKYVHIRAYTDDQSDSEFWETVYRLDLQDNITAKLISAGEVSSSNYISNFLGNISNIKIERPGIVSVKQVSQKNKKVYVSHFRFINQELKLLTLTLIDSGNSKLIIDNTVVKTDFYREAVKDYMFTDIITSFKVITKIKSHDGSRTYVYGRAMSPTKFDDPKWWDTIYVVDNFSGKIISRLIDGNVVAGDSNLRYFMGQVRSISLTESGFLEIKQGPSRLKDNNYSITKYEDKGSYLKIISIETLSEDGKRFKNQ